MDDTDSALTPMAALFQKRMEQPKKRATERGELLKHFAQKLNTNIRFVAFKVTKMNLQDLYFIKSDCDQAEARGIPWGAAFYTSLKEPTHES